MEITESKVEEILNKILNQLEKGKIIIGDEELGEWTFYVKLLNENSKINNGELSFKIQNKGKLNKYLKDYLSVAKKFYIKDKDYYDLSEQSFCEKLILDLIVNATNFDLNNFEAYVKQRMEMIKEDLKAEEKIVGQYLNTDILVETKKNKSNLEGPYKFNIKFDNNLESFNLPSVCFGKIDDELFVYSIQGEKEKQTNWLAKKLDRHFRKANKDVDMQDEILSQVSVSALVSLTIFLAYFKTLGVKKITAYNFMPLRYDSKHQTQMLRLKEEHKEAFEEENNRNQFNITNRFFNTLVRYAHHFNIDFDYDDVCEKLEMKLKNNNQNNENIILDIENAVINGLESLKIQ